MEKVNKQLVDMNRNIGTTKSLKLDVGGTVVSVRAEAGAASQEMSPATGQAGGVAGMAGGGGGATAYLAIAQAVGAAISKVVDASFARYQSGANTG